METCILHKAKAGGKSTNNLLKLWIIEHGCKVIYSYHGHLGHVYSGHGKEKGRDQSLILGIPSWKQIQSCIGSRNITLRMYCIDPQASH